ncbi:putative capsular polysaccharide bisynthesis protein [Paenibacillus sp. TCA20]|uniref:hypothetical protein n=1 Tax=Paenibacillus sp. TCA20 TaxID=1499968 RepID=UPI0004DA2E42|nr:hypothetical protein [Paenibacillus sp. TCA20]GAK41976.1 putative capsular polysaccharide bisynthesis protein [Paenibacillus sp. TCA20]
MKRSFMDVVGPGLDFIADRLLVCILIGAFLATLAILLEPFGILIILALVALFAFYIRWDLRRQSIEEIIIEEEEIQWEDKSKQHA